MGRVPTRNAPTSATSRAKNLGFTKRDDQGLYKRVGKGGNTIVRPTAVDKARIYDGVNPDSWTAVDAGTTHNERGQEVQLKDQAKLVRNGSFKQPGRWEVQKDQSWQDYNKMMREMRNRVQYGVRKRRSGEQSQRIGKGGIRGASAGGAARRATLAAPTTAAQTLYDEE